MPATGKRMDTVCQLGFIILLLLPGSASQSIVFPSNITQQTTTCSDRGLIDGVDVVQHFGQVDKGTSTKPLILSFQAKNASISTSIFIEDCYIDIDTDGCGPSSRVYCYCASYDNSTSSYTVVYYKRADIAKSEYKLQLNWQGVVVQPGPPIDMPLVHGKADISVTCTGGQSADDCCPFQGKQKNPLKFCVSNLDSPKLFIKIGGTDRATATTNCITFTVSASETGTELVFLYRERIGCKRTGNLTCSLGSASQSLVFPSSITQQTTICADHGVIDGVDHIKHFGQVDTGTSTKLLLFVFEVKNASDPKSIFGADCFVDITKNGCGRSSIDPCYCTSQDSSTLYTVVYNRVGDLRKSEYKLRLRWIAESIDPTTPIDMPIVHGKADISVTCTGGQSADDCCPFQGKQRNPLKFCVSNLDSPKLFIKIGGTDRATATTNCITFTVSASETGTELVFLYRERGGCKRTGNFTCTLATTVTTTTETTSRASITTPDTITSSTVILRTSTSSKAEGISCYNINPYMSPAWFILFIWSNLMRLFIDICE